MDGWHLEEQESNPAVGPLSSFPVSEGTREPQPGDVEVVVWKPLQLHEHRDDTYVVCHVSSVEQFPLEEEF